MAPVLTCKFMKHSIFKKRTENSRCLLVALCHAGAGSAGWPGVEGFGKFHPKGHCTRPVPGFDSICALLSASREGPLLKLFTEGEKKG